MNAVDTNVLVYSLDADEPVKQAKAKALLAKLATTAWRMRVVQNPRRLDFF